MKTRRPCKLKFLVEFESLVKIRISVTGCVVTQATKFVANINSRIICKFLIMQAKLNELLFSTRKLFVACIIILIIRELALPDLVAQWALLVPAFIVGQFASKALLPYKEYLPDPWFSFLVIAVVRAILGLPLL